MADILITLTVGDILVCVCKQVINIHELQGPHSGYGSILLLFFK